MVSITYRKIASIEGMYNERFVADVYDAADTIARMEGGASTRIVFHSAMVIAMLNVLKIEYKNMY